MKHYYVIVLMASVLSTVAMEKPFASKKRPAEEEQPAPSQKLKRESETAAVIREPVAQMETQRELSPEVQEHINYLRALAQRGEFPNEIAAQILKNLANVKVAGATEDQKLYNAIANIRAFMEAFPQFYGDVGINEYLIRELDKKYMHNALFKVAIALATTGAGQWLVGYVGTDDIKKAGIVDYLHAAVEKGELGNMRFILKYFPQWINEKNPLSGFTALGLAVKQEHPHVVKELLNSPQLNINRDDQGSFALWLASNKGQLVIVEQLLQAPGINVNAQTPVTGPALMIAAENGHRAIVDRLLQVPGVNVNAKTSSGHTALMLAAYKGHTAVVDRLLQARGINVNSRTPQGITALRFARQSKSPNKDAIIKRLIEFGAIE